MKSTIKTLYLFLLAINVYSLLPLRNWQQEYLAYYYHFLFLINFFSILYFAYAYIFCKRSKLIAIQILFSILFTIKFFVPIYPFFFQQTAQVKDLIKLEDLHLKIAFFPISLEEDLNQLVNIEADPDLLILHSKENSAVFDGFYSEYKYRETVNNLPYAQYSIFSKLPINNFAVTDMQVEGFKLLSFELNKWTEQKKLKEPLKVYTLVASHYTASSSDNLELLQRRAATILRAQTGRLIFAYSMFATPFNKSYARLVKGANFKHAAWGHSSFLLHFDLLQNHLFYKGKIYTLDLEQIDNQGYLADFVVY